MNLLPPGGETCSGRCCDSVNCPLASQRDAEGDEPANTRPTAVGGWAVGIVASGAARFRACRFALATLRRSQHQSARCVQYQIQRHFRVGQLNGTDNFLAVVDINIAYQRKSQQTHRLLPINEQNDARVSFTF
jgi:hypothetical protein